MIKIQSKEHYEEVVEEVVELYNQKDYHQSLAKFLQLAEYNYDNLKVHEMLCYNYLKLNSIKEAEAEFEIALKLAKDKDIRLELKTFDELVKDIGNEDLIKKEYENLVQNGNVKDYNPKQSAIVVKMGILYMAKGMFQKAEEIIKRYRDQLLPMSEATN